MGGGGGEGERGEGPGYLRLARGGGGLFNFVSRSLGRGGQQFNVHFKSVPLLKVGKTVK